MSRRHRRLRLQLLLRLSVRSCPRRSRRREPGRAMVVGPCREFFPACEGEPASFPSISARFTERLWLLLFSAAEPSPGLCPRLRASVSPPRPPWGRHRSSRPPGRGAAYARGALRSSRPPSPTARLFSGMAVEGAETIGLDADEARDPLDLSGVMHGRANRHRGRRRWRSSERRGRAPGRGQPGADRGRGRRWSRRPASASPWPCTSPTARAACRGRPVAAGCGRHGPALRAAINEAARQGA